MTFQKLREFNFPRGLAPGLLNGFSIGRNEKNRESFNLFAAKIESRAMRFLGENFSGVGVVQNMDSALVLLLLGTVNSKLKILQNCSKNCF